MDHEDKKYKCTKCLKTKPSDQFRWKRGPNGRMYRHSCLVCTKLMRAAWHEANKERASRSHKELRQKRMAEGGRRSLEWYLARHLSGWRFTSREQGLPEMDLDVPYLLELFERQNGRCHYTGAVLEWNTHGVKHAGLGSANVMSLDRQVPSLGYVRGNVVFCTYQANSMKGKRTQAEFLEACRAVVRTHG